MTDGQKMVWAAVFARRVTCYGDSYPTSDIVHMAAEFASTIVEDLVEQAPEIVKGHGVLSRTGRMTKAMVES